MSDIFITLAKKINVFNETSLALASIQEKLLVNKKAVIGFANAHAFNLAKSNEDFFVSLISYDFLLRDGIGLKILFKLLKMDYGINLNGTDFIPLLLRKFSPGKRIAIFGTEESVIQSSLPFVESFGGKVILTAHGFHDYEFYLESARSKNVDIYILAMGMPKQEIVASILNNKIDTGLIICGGAIIDFLGGKVKRAPLIYRKLGLEWFYRLLVEPRRLFKRYVIGNFSFLLSAFRSIK